MMVAHLYVDVWLYTSSMANWVRSIPSFIQLVESRIILHDDLGRSKEKGCELLLKEYLYSHEIPWFDYFNLNWSVGIHWERRIHE
jgi:hypothetical protein